MRPVNAREDLPYWVALNLALADNTRILQKITAHFPSIIEAFTAPLEEFSRLGIEKRWVNKITSAPILEKSYKEIERCKKNGYTILTFGDTRYPERLREIFDPPPVLYCGGMVEALAMPAVAVVGARKPSAYGRAVTERLASDLAERGLIIVSGLARGIDSFAHWGALREGKTIAVLGSGLENVYPRENRNLNKKIMERGTVITEFPLRSSPLGFHFPMRNRIISGLSVAVVVVEATKRSGSLITGRLALEQNREVMAVPGNITSELSQGTNLLIKNGAKAVESWRDVVEEFPSPLRERIFEAKPSIKPFPALSEQEKALLKFLPSDSLTHIDEIIEAKRLSVSEVLTLLLSLELKDMISQRPGNYYYRKL